MTDDLQEAREDAANYALTRSIHGPDADHEDFDYYRKHTAIALAAADAHLPSVEMIADEIANAWDGHEINVREAARAVRALFGEVAGDE